MGIDWKKFGQFAIDGGKSLVRVAEKRTCELEKAAEKKAKEQGAFLSDKSYAKLDDMYEKIDNAYDILDNIEERFYSRFEGDDEEDYYDESSEKETYSFDNSDDIIYDLKEEFLKEKVEQQINSASKEYIYTDDDIVNRESEWCPLGRLKDIDVSQISQNVAGLIRMKVEERIVYISRVIEIKSGGFQKKYQI